MACYLNNNDTLNISNINILDNEIDLYEINKELNSTLLKINDLILKEEEFEEGGKHVPARIKMEIQKNKYSLLNIYQCLIHTYPVKLQFSDQQKNCFPILSFDPDDITIVDDYFHFPWFNWHIPPEMDSLMFTIGDYKLRSIELEFGVFCENNDVIRKGFTIHEKLGYELEELKQAIRSKSDFKPHCDSLLFHQYKIHFMPKPEHFSWCVINLIKKISQDAILKSHLHTMKVAIDPYEDLSELEHRPPSIVVYPMLGKEHAQQALTILFNHFKSDLERGSHQIPRFNVETKNDLITYAQGDGYKKLKILEKHPRLFSKVYDSDGAHFNAKFGSFRLTVPEDF